MRSLSEMRIIEIDITNACVHSCSNCTRFCGHHKEPYFMSFSDFKNAIDSLDEYEGMAGIMGGEPTLHPEFERFISYLKEKRGINDVSGARGPIRDMQLHILGNLNTGVFPTRTVLLSSLNYTYYKHFETINDTFSYQLLNDHANKVEHQALLMTRKELGIPDEEWIKKRDACWIQNNWSGSITSKGAFFCEVAGALDMLFDGPGGWKVEPGWWKRTPEDFGDQLHWCEMCSGCLDAPKRVSSEDIDDVTPVIYERLKEMESPKLKKGRVVVRDPAQFSEYSSPTYVNGSEYIVEKGENMRMSAGNKSLFPKDIYVITSSELYQVLFTDKASDWILVSDGDRNFTEEWIKQFVWNPGCIYVIDGEHYFLNVNAASIPKEWEGISCEISDILKLYPKNKTVRVSSKDPLLSVMGGDPEELAEGLGDRDGKKLLIFGAGMMAEMAIRLLEKDGFNDFAVAVTDPSENRDEILGHKVYAISDFADEGDSYVVLMSATPVIREDMKRVLSGYGFKNYRAIV